MVVGTKFLMSALILGSMVSLSVNADEGKVNGSRCALLASGYAKYLAAQDLVAAAGHNPTTFPVVIDDANAIGGALTQEMYDSHCPAPSTTRETNVSLPRTGLIKTVIFCQRKLLIQRVSHDMIHVFRMASDSDTNEHPKTTLVDGAKKLNDDITTDMTAVGCF